MRAARFNPPPPFRGPGVLDKKPILSISSFSAPRTLCRAIPKMQGGRLSSLKFSNFHVFRQFFAPSKIHQISTSFQNLQKSQKSEPERKMDGFLLISNAIWGSSGSGKGVQKSRFWQSCWRKSEKRGSRNGSRKNMKFMMNFGSKMKAKIRQKREVPSAR